MADCPLAGNYASESTYNNRSFKKPLDRKGGDPALIKLARATA
jgi:hypothetical protein